MAAHHHPTSPLDIGAHHQPTSPLDMAADHHNTAPAMAAHHRPAAPAVSPHHAAPAAHHTTQPPSKLQQLVRSDRRMFSGSDDSMMMKQVLATHAPDGRDVDVKPILYIIEDVLRCGIPIIDGVINGTEKAMDALEEDKTSFVTFDGLLEAVAFIIQKISCEILCKCTGGGDAHATAMALFNTLSSYSWEAKVVLSLAALAVIYGEFWLVTQLCTSNSLAKSVGLLKQLPDILEHSNSLKPQFEVLNKLIKASMDVTKCIIDFTELPSQYISTDTPAMSTAMALIPTASYWTIRSIVACAAKIAALVGMSHEYMPSATETWELSSLAHKVRTIHEHLLNQITLCYQHIDEKKHIEAYHNLLRLFETLHMDNMKILKALIYSKDDQPPLYDPSTGTRVHIEVLRRKHVLLLISDLDLTSEEVSVLRGIHEEQAKGKADYHYEVVWLPIMDRSAPWNDANEQRFSELQRWMPWFTVHHPLMIEPAVIKYIKEVWCFTKKAIIVPLDPQGRVSSKNALHMLWIWGNAAFPFTDEREEVLWKAQTWQLDLIVDDIDRRIRDWMTEARFICLYGGEDVEWIRKFTSAVKAVAFAVGLRLEMVYVGKSNSKVRVSKINTIIAQDDLSHYWEDFTLVWFFWARQESMLYSKMQRGKTVENDQIMQEVMTLLSFDGSDQGWAIFWNGPSEMARAKGETALRSIQEFDEWKDDANQHGLMPALTGYLQKLHSPHHCNRLILPGITGGVPERVVCAECGRPMEKYFMYRCCVD